MTIKVLVALVAVAAAGNAITAARRPERAPVSNAPAVPVLVELFTSEGCSSCPPADELLRQLDETQPVSGAEAIVLSEHVDYWDRLGWRDPFSSAAFTARQQQYVLRLRAENAYTPQAVIDGGREVVGSDRAAVTGAIARAATRPKGTLSVQVTPAGPGSVSVAVTGQVAGGAGADVFVGLAERDLTVAVARGENARKTLRHTGVVRVLTRVGQADPSGRIDVRAASVALQPSWHAAALRVVAFAQGSNQGPVTAIGVAALPASR